jgi:VWFA-related protein
LAASLPVGTRAVTVTSRTLRNLLALRLAPAFLVTAALVAQQPRPTFKTEANFVRVDVYATKGGVPLADLTASDFELLEDGAPQAIETFEHIVVRPAGPQETRVEPDSQRQGNQMAEDPRARVFVVFLDTYHVSVQGSHNIRAPLIQLLDRAIGQEDLVGVMTPEMSAANLTLGRKTQVLQGALTDNWVWGRRFQITQLDPKEEQYRSCYQGWVDGEAVIREMIARRRERLTLESVEDLVTHLRGLREERKAIITVSEGWAQFRENRDLARPLKGHPQADPVVPGKPEVFVDPSGKIRSGSDPRATGNDGSMYECDADRQRLASMDNERYFRDILDEANRANASFYPVDPRGLPVFDTPMGPEPPLPVNADAASLRTRQESLRTLAVATDGIAVMNSNDIESGLKRMADDLTSYYLLGYYSTNTKLDGKFRAIKVRVKQPGVEVRARRGYRAATAEEISAAAGGPKGSAPQGSRRANAEPDGDGAGSQLGAQSGTQTSLAVSTALGRLTTLRPNTPFHIHAVIVRGPDGPRAWVAGELDAATARGPTWARGADASVAAGPQGGDASSNAALEPPARAFLVGVPVSLDDQGSVTIQARLRPRGDPTGPLTAIVSARLPDEGKIFLASDPLLFTLRGTRAIPVATFRIYRTERARLELPVDAAATLDEARLLDRSGKPMAIPVQVTERSTEGLRWLVAELNPAPLAPGDYIVELSATRGSTSETVVAALRIVS